MISIKKNMIPGLGRTGFGRDEIYPDLPRMGSIIVSLIDQGTIQSIGKVKKQQQHGTP